MQNDLFTFLTNNVTLAARFGSRIYHEWIPQTVNTFPCLVFQQVSRSSFSDDMSDPASGIDQVGFQFDIVDDDSAGLVAATDEFDSVFRAYRGTIGGTKIQHIALDNITQSGQMLGDKQRRRAILDYSIYFDA